MNESALRDGIPNKCLCIWIINRSVYIESLETMINNSQARNKEWGPGPHPLSYSSFFLRRVMHFDLSNDHLPDKISTSTLKYNLFIKLTTDRNSFLLFWVFLIYMNEAVVVNFNTPTLCSLWYSIRQEVIDLPVRFISYCTIHCLELTLT